MSIGLKSDSSGTSGSIVINGSDAVLVTPTGITTASIQDSSITTAKIVDGNITFGKLSNSATEADNVAKRTAKAWVNFDGTGTVAIRDDFNVSSITDNGTGDYTINLSSNLLDTNYSVIATSSAQFSSNWSITQIHSKTGIIEVTPLTGSFGVCVINSGATAMLDVKYISVSVF